MDTSQLDVSKRQLKSDLKLLFSIASENLGELSKKGTVDAKENARWLRTVKRDVYAGLGLARRRR